MLLQHGQKLTLHGGGQQRKRYLYAGDAANAFNVILHKATAGEVYNLGSYDEISNRDLAAKILACVGRPGGGGGSSDSSSESEEASSLDAWIQTVPGRPYVDSGSGLDCEKLRGLEWEQKVGWEDGLGRTVKWYSAHGDTWWGDLGKTFGLA